MPINLGYLTSKYAERSSAYAATVAYNTNGKVSSITQNNMTYTVGRTSGRITSITDGSRTITLVRGTDGRVTSWSIA